MNGADGIDWMSFIGLFFQCGTPLFLIALGWFVGSTVERRHLRSLRRREQVILTIPLTDLKTQPPGINGTGAMLVSGSVVIGSDYFKTFCAACAS